MNRNNAKPQEYKDFSLQTHKSLCLLKEIRSQAIQLGKICCAKAITKHKVCLIALNAFANSAPTFKTKDNMHIMRNFQADIEGFTLSSLSVLSAPVLSNINLKFESLITAFAARHRAGLSYAFCGLSGDNNDKKNAYRCLPPGGNPSRRRRRDTDRRT